MKIHEKLKSLRLSKNKTQSELAKMLSIPRYLVSNWEQGRSSPSLDDLVSISKFFNVSVDYLLGIEDEFGNVNVDANTNGLSNEETELIKNFRLLDDVQRRAVSRTAKSFADDNTSLSKVDVKNNF